MYDNQLHNLKRERDIAFGLSIIILVLGVFVY